MMHTEEINEMLKKFHKEESLLDKLLNERNDTKQINESDGSPESKLTSITLEDVVKRNKEMIQELELVKGRLRSKAIFSPTEIQWDSICQKYQDTPSLPVKTWKCHLPAYI